jgi:hypothetical protein
MLHAQQFGGNPASVKWRQINTDTVRIIFSEGDQARAERAASVIHSIQNKYAQSVGGAIRKISIVLQNQGLQSNGYVALAPYRSEWYTTAPQNTFGLGANAWTDLLATHEFRHVQQYSNFNKGLSHIATFFLGQEGQAAANALAIPDWFFEGDAVYNETKLSKQGRGKLPLFLSSYQSLFLSGRQYSYMKMRNGSFRDYVPDHYALGYLLVAYGRKKYGEDIWRKITDEAVRFKPLFYPFQGALKKQTGISFNRFVSDAMLSYQQQWKTGNSDSVAWITTKPNHSIVNYQYPYLSESGSLIVVKTGNRQVPSFYRLFPDGKEQKIAVKNISSDNYFSYRNGKIIYAAYQPDTRWANRDYHSIRVLDISSGEEKKLISRTRFFSPDISSDGKKMVAVWADEYGKASLVFMNMDGQQTDSIAAQDLFYSYPKFSANGANCYVAARNGAGNMTLLKYATDGSHRKQVLFPLSEREIGFISVQSDTVLFTTTYQERDELWGIIDGKETKGPFRLATYPTGLYQGAFLQNGQLAVSAFTADGYRIGTFQPRWERVVLRDELKDLYVGNVFNPQDHDFLETVINRNFPVSKYPKSFHLLNIHSFRPYYDNPEYSLTFYGENVLNTFQSQIAYTYNQNEGSHRASYQGVFGGTYLQPVFGVSERWNRTALYKSDTLVHWNELEAYAGLQLPLNLSGGKHYRYLTIASTYRIDQVNWTGVAEKLFRNKIYPYQETRISFSSEVQKSQQQIYPHFAGSLYLQYRSLVSSDKARQFLASGAVYLPGLADNHSLVLTAAYHGRDTLQQYLFSNDFPFSRGYQGVDFPRMWRVGVNYHLPLVYPDRGFGNMVYFLRVRANLFFDYTEGKSLRTGTRYPFRTAGTELYFDTRWWNQQPVSFGIRYSRLLDNEFSGITRPNVWELILPVNLFK